jgi:hypothetical protein
VKLAIQTLNHKREIVWENDKFKEIFGTDDRRGHKCWELIHPDNPVCEKCEARGSHLREISQNGGSRQYFINNSRLDDRGFVKFIEEVDQITHAYETVNKEIQKIKEKLSTLVDRLDLIVICSSCKRIRLRDGTWVDDPMNGSEQLYAKNLSHGYCPECARQIISEI